MIEHDSLSSIKSRFPDLYGWVKSITRYGDFDNFVVVDPPEENPRQYALVKFWTAEHYYRISARLPWDNDKNEDGYLGCVVSARKPLAGEYWKRGNDLPDGHYSEKTWLEIVSAIVAYELSKVAVSTPPKPVEEREDEALGIISAIPVKRS